MKYEDTLLPQDVRRERLRRMAQFSISRRVEMVSELRESVKQVAREVLKATKPELSEAEIEREVRRRLTLR
jgi:hypothetical protein